MTPTPSSKNTPETGILILVVGPSGVGKDTLLEGAHSALADRPDFVFVRRDITRPAGAGGEDHNPVSEGEFTSRVVAGDYLLHWRAHGLGYGVPVVAANQLAAGQRVVVNVSRSVLDEARRRFGQLRIVSVEADARRLAQRLRARGRENEADIARRIAQADAFEVSGDDVVVVRNDGSPEEGVMAMISAITRDA
ncbi:MAG: phosphonate metabolism protein/1,5-bisphosphokinase (PRPP-forming) PhnN [Pseudomonadota bacterium]